MKVGKYRWGILLILAALSYNGCEKDVSPGSENGPASSEEGTRRIGESCNDSHKCVNGLICEDALCRKVCKVKEDCPQNYDCESNRCYPSSELERAKIGERCDSSKPCEPGLVCYNGENICRTMCNGDDNCPDDTPWCKAGGCFALPDPVGLGQGCDEHTKCINGLTCYSSICYNACETAADCPKDARYACTSKACIVDESGLEVADGMKKPTGGQLVPISGRASNGSYTTKAVGGSFQGDFSNSTVKTKVNDGNWDK